MTIPITFSGETVVAAIKSAIEHDNGYLGVVLIKQENPTSYYKSELYHVGTVVKIIKTSRIDNDTMNILIQSLHRFEYVRTLKEEPYARWEIKTYFESKPQNPAEFKPYVFSIMDGVKNLLRLNPLLQEQIKMLLGQQTYETPHVIIDLVASILSTKPEKLQDLLETFDTMKRAEKLLVLLTEEMEIIHLQEKLQAEIKEKIDKQQKDYFLREQLKAIKKELGIEKDDKTSDIEKIQGKIKELKLTDEAGEVIKEQLEKLSTLDLQSPEYQVTRSYLTELTSLPWGVYSKENHDIKRARNILDEGHYGLADVKERILQFISTVVKRGKVSGSIICLVGPPGVGKTSIGKSVAEALGRNFYRFSVGGMRDEAEIKGHRRTYIGAMPGKIMQALKRTKTQNPVIMLDEIDKIGTSYMGDPSSALLEVLDPEQNKDFLDHYLDVRFDLSQTLFITTANQLDTIPAPLLDRMEIIRLSGYLQQEKVAIAKNFLVPKQLKEHGLKPREFAINDQALAHIADQYSREAGVRGFEGQIKKIMRKVALEQVENSAKKVTITLKNIETYLGKPEFSPEELYDRPKVGVALGLAWTALGGATLYIEAAALKSSSAALKQTGQLGKVMQESSEIAYSYVRSRLADHKKYNDFFDSHQIHLHVPAGATPKDGPSAGITMALALYSLATAKPIPTLFAMTGELTLTGKVLPIGGVKEKLIAASRMKVKQVLLPSANKKDFDELPGYIHKGLKVKFVEHFDDVLKASFKGPV
jgi:ATP-dependent Lon protease